MASIRLFDPNDKSKGFLADTGVRGAGGRRLCATEEEAKAFLAAKDKNPRPAKVLYEREAELMDCYDRLVAVGATFREAVDYFIKFGASTGNPKFSELVERVIAAKKDVSKSEDYFDNLRKAARYLLEFLGDDPHARDITAEQLRQYFYVANRKMSKGYRKSQFTHLNVIFRYALKHRLVPGNEMTLLERPPNSKKNPPEAIKPRHLERLLTRCYEKGWHGRLAVFVLMAFVGIRKEEISRVRWDCINLQKKKLTLDADAVKTGDIYRRLTIPDNAAEWLELVWDKRKKRRIIGRTWESLCRSAILSAKIPYAKNVIRNAFPSYAFEAGWKEKDIKYHMGHSKTSSIVWAHYVALVEPEDVKKFWAITPQRTVLKKSWEKFKNSPKFGLKQKNNSTVDRAKAEFLPDDVDITP